MNKRNRLVLLTTRQLGQTSNESSKFVSWYGSHAKDERGGQRWFSMWSSGVCQFSSSVMVRFGATTKLRS